MTKANALRYLLPLLLFSLGVVSCSTNLVRPVETEELKVELIRGSRLPIVVVAPDELQSSSKLLLSQEPQNGVARPGDNPGTLVYQHGGVDRTADLFVVEWRDPDGTLYSKTVNLEFRDRIARVVVTAPRNGSVHRSGDIQVKYQTQGQDFDHLHISLDNQGHNTIRELTGSFTLRNVPVGEHLVSASLVDKNHNSLGGADAKSVVRISVVP